MAETPPRMSSRTAVFFIQIVYLVALGVFVTCYRVQWIEPRRDFFGPVPFLVPWFGAVGAVLLSLNAVFTYTGEEWNTAFRFWHWSRPLIGGVVATVSVLIFQSGILAVGGQLPNNAHTSTTKNLLYYLVAFIVGYREDVFRQLIARLADVILTPGESKTPSPPTPGTDSTESPDAAAGEQDATP